MSSNQQALLPEIVVSLHSSRWMAAVQRAAQDATGVKLHWTASIQKALSAASDHPGCAVIAEWPKSTEPEILATQLAAFTNNPHRAMLFLLGDESHESSASFFSSTLVADFATSILDFAPLWNRAIEHLHRHQITGLSVEELVEARFPFS